ncbi:uncharacterized protein NPIL_389141 [Nephila pilipes]|uniref:Uncharacterized protein n=1 Tax=Nephila pilipes TaxID=299642 RepID=A0A8X6QHD2_NEPPI|nr:uncharacterized protein NPIL_389141 [Nephila pilipes]
MIMGSVLLSRKLCSRSVILFNKTQKYLSYSMNQNISSCSKITCSSMLINHHICRRNLPSLISSRTFWETFPSTRPLYYLKDGLDPTNHELVYRSKFFNYAFYGQFFSQFTFCAQIGGSLYMLYNILVGKGFVPITQIGSFTLTYDSFTLFVILLLTIQNALLYITAQKALLRIYHKRDTDEYVFVNLSFNPFKSRLLTCKPGELKMLNIENLKAMIKGNHQVGNRRYFLSRSYFKNDKYYLRLVYDENI